MLNEFKKFILRGSVVDLAVGLAVGAAFTSVVNSLVKGLIDPLVSLFYGGSKLADLSFTVSGKRFMYGDVLNNVIIFLIVAAVIFFLVVKPINKLSAMAFGAQASGGEATRKCPECLSKVPKEARRCLFCTSQLKPKS